MKKSTVVLACVVVAAVALGVMFLRTSEEDRVRKILVEFTKALAVKDGDTVLSRGARVRAATRELVDDDVRVDIAELSVDVRGRAKLEEDAMRVGLLWQRADCELSNLSVKVDPEGTVATADAVATVTATTGGERKVDRRDVHFLLRKGDGWKIATIDVAPRKD